MKRLQRSWLVVLLCLLALISRPVSAADDDEPWMPSPPRLAYIDGEVSYWRPGAEEWARAQPNLALAEGDALYAGERSNLEVQFGPRSFVRADEDTQLSLVAQEARRIQFSVTTGRASFDLRSIEVGDILEVSTPNAVFVIDQAGYYRVEVGGSETHFVTRRGGEATVVTTDGRSLGIYPSEEIVVTAGDPAKVATYAAPPPDAWDRWNDARSDRYGESISARYLPSDVYGAEELDRHGHWRIVPTYGAVWIPYAVSVDWAPYSTGYWVWDAYYEWTWVDDAPWGWAPFHYGRWVHLDGYWAWAPGPIMRRSVYSPALVGFMVRDGVSARLSLGLPGLWWVALSWGEPVIPWWGPPRHRGHPRWHGWGGPRIVNNVVVTQTTVINLVNLRFSNAARPRAVLTVPPDRFGRDRVHARVENRYRHTDFAPVRGELPVKPSRASLVGGAPKGAQPPRDVVARPVVSTRAPRERRFPEQIAPPRTGARAVPDANFVIPPTRRVDDRRALPRPPLGADAGPERTPPPRPPRYEELRGADRPGAPGARPRQQSEETSEPRTPAPAGQRETAPARPRGEAAPAPPTRRETPGETRGQSRERGESAPPATRETPPARPRSEAPPPRPEATRERATTREQAAERERVIERREAAPPRAPAAPSEQPVERRATTREQAVDRREVRPAPARDAAPLQERAQPRGRSEDPRGDVRQESRERPLPGQPANRVFRGREPRDPR
jgi:hypothetical protein